MATLGTGGKKETTEWEDILKSKGIIPKKTAEEEAEDAVKQMIEETVERYDPHEKKKVEELDEELEEADSDEERILIEYRTKRLAEMKAEALRRRFGPGVEYVAANEWKKEVTNAGEGIFVVVHLFQPGLEACVLMERILANLAKRFRFTKFVKCKSTDAIRNYPDERCPTLLIYLGGKVVKQFIGLSEFAGLRTGVEHVEWELKQLGAVKSEMTEAPNGVGSTDFKLNLI